MNAKHKPKFRLEDILKVVEDTVSDDACHEWVTHVSSSPETMSATEKAMLAKLQFLYRFSHSLNRKHLCHYAHTDWRAEALNAVQQLTARERGERRKP